jgi:hypothetical protein
VSVIERDSPTYVVKVIPEGKSAERLDLSERVLSFIYEDAEKKADKLTLTVDNWDLKNFDDPVWKKGNILEVSWGYPGDMAPTRQCVIQSVKGFQALSIEAHAKSVLMNKVAKTRVFENMTRAEVARKIADENGYGSSVQDVEDTEASLPHVTQARLTDAQFLKKLATREGFEFYIDASGFHFHKRRTGQKPIRILRWYTDPEQGDFLNITIDNDVTGKPGAVRLKGRDPLRKKDFEGNGTNDTTDRESLAPVIEIVDPKTGESHLEKRASSEETRHTTGNATTAKREAEGRFRNVQHLTVELSASIAGDPRVLAKTVIEIQGIGKRLSGKYYIKEAKHKIDGSGYQVDFKSLRDGHGGYDRQGAKSKGNLNTKRPGDPRELRRVEVVDSRTGATHVEWRPGAGEHG